MSRLGAGTSMLSGRWGTMTGYDAGAALQQQMAKEQWDWQKRMYEQTLADQPRIQGSLSQLINQYNQAYNQAKAANLQRYQQGLDIIGQTTGQREADIRSDYAGRQADIMQQLARTGMANTTVAPTMGLGVEREQQSALNRLADQLQGTKLGWIERREDEYPKSDVLLGLVQALGQGGAASKILQNWNPVQVSAQGLPTVA